MCVFFFFAKAYPFCAVLAFAFDGLISHEEARLNICSRNEEVKMLVTSSKISSEETWLGLYCKLGVWAKAKHLRARPHISVWMQHASTASCNESAESQRCCAEFWQTWCVIYYVENLVCEGGKPYGLFPVSYHLSYKKTKNPKKQLNRSFSLF